MPDLDPFSQVYNRIWDILEARDGEGQWSQRVRPGNRINYAGQHRRPEKPTRAPADAPEVAIVPVPGGDLKLTSSSSSSRARQNYGIRVRTGDLRVHTALFPLRYEIFRAFAGQPKDMGLPAFVVNHQIKDIVDDTLLNARLNANEGYESLYVVEVDFQFNTAALGA